MDYIQTFKDYCSTYFRSKDVRVSIAKTKQQRITEFERILQDVINKAENNLNEQIKSLMSLAYKDGHAYMSTLNQELQNSLRDQIRNFRTEQDQKSRLHD